MLLTSHYARLREVAADLSVAGSHGTYEADLLIELVREAEARDQPQAEQVPTGDLAVARLALAQIAAFARQQTDGGSSRESRTMSAPWEYVEHLAQTALDQPAFERGERIARARARLESAQRRRIEMMRDQDTSNIRDIVEKAERLRERTAAHCARVEQHHTRRPRRWPWRAR